MQGFRDRSVLCFPYSQAREAFLSSSHQDTTGNQSELAQYTFHGHIIWLGVASIKKLHSSAKIAPQGNRRVKGKEEDVRPAWWRKLLRLGPSWVEVARALEPSLPANLRLVKADDLPARILTIEEKQVRPCGCWFLFTANLSDHSSCPDDKRIQVWHSLRKRRTDEGGRDVC